MPTFSLFMSFSVYLWGIRLFLFLSLAAWIGIVIAVDPYRSGQVGLGLFFVSLFGTILGSLTLMMTWIYRKALGAQGVAHHLGGAFRQSFLLSLFFILLVFLQMRQWLTWWDALLVLTAVLLLEFTARRLTGNRS